jgi:hypothetical protein
MYDETDPANPQGMQRNPQGMQRLATKKVYQDDPKNSRTKKSRTMIPVLTKSRQRPTIAVGEGNNPQGMPRPQNQGAPYDQDLDPDY